MDGRISDREWEKFFEIMDKIVAGGKPWREKADEVLSKGTEMGSDGTLEEFVGWFQGQ